jgi:hypothetical protein
MSQSTSHTHCQATQANAKAKACQRVCLSERTGDNVAKLIENEIKRQKSPVPNIMYKTLRSKWLCVVFCPALAFVTADRDDARNPQRFMHVTVTLIDYDLPGYD